MFPLRSGQAVGYDRGIAKYPLPLGGLGGASARPGESESDLGSEPVSCLDTGPPYANRPTEPGRCQETRMGAYRLAIPTATALATQRLQGVVGDATLHRAGRAPRLLLRAPAGSRPGRGKAPALPQHRVRLSRRPASSGVNLRPAAFCR